MAKQDVEYHRKHRSEVAPFLPPVHERILEIGCGEGRFRANISGPCEYVGVEPSPQAAEVARGVLDSVHTGIYDEVADRLPLAHFDLVICNDVIEHMPDHDAFLERVKAHMRPGAWLVGSVPNVRYINNVWELMVGRDWRYRDHGILDSTHLRFFTMKSWRRALEGHGYVVEAAEGVNPIYLGANPLKVAAKNLLITAIGADCRYQQCGFRARLIS